jgi:hypothetical protein
MTIFILCFTILILVLVISGNGYLEAIMDMVLLRLRSEISLPIMRELVPHYLQDTGRVCFIEPFLACTYIKHFTF